MLYFSLLLFIIYIAVVVVSYKKREEEEENLAWKLVGYLILSIFTLYINGFPLPLGLAIAFFLKPETNASAKNNMRILGIINYIIVLITPL